MHEAEIFKTFPVKEWKLNGFVTTFAGSCFRREFQDPSGNREGRYEPIPPVGEDFFEWISILECIRDAQDDFTMMELGAGYGRWLLNAAAAVKRMRNIPVNLTGVEAEPSHFRWMQLAFEDNGLSPHEYELIEAAVTPNQDKIYFYVRMPDSEQEEMPVSWYGQSLINDYDFGRIDEMIPDGEYMGKPTYRLPSNFSVMEVPCVKLSQLLEPVETVDLIDLDVQGAELDVLAEAAGPLNEKVKRVHIGTHGRDIETGLKVLFKTLGWEKLWDFPCFSEGHSTPYGPCDFNDGILSYRNPSFS